jgi:predicted CXXCH cytochrome family protein
MKKQSLTKMLVALLAVPLAFVAGGNALAAGVADTKHNLSTSKIAAAEIYSTDQTEICVFCHTPHNALKNSGATNYLPLWNHTLSGTTSYGTYTSVTMNATTSDIGEATLAGATTSHLCLSCHDGTVAVNSFNRASTINSTTTMAGAGQTAGKISAGRGSNLGTDLSNDHPINFTYDAALVTADKGTAAAASLKDPGALTGVKLFNNTVQCASCHDPHTSQDASGKGLVRVTMNSSQLCTSCHIK